MTAKAALESFVALAHAKGYGEKVVGDYAYQITRHPDSPIFKLHGARDGRLQVFETGRGRYDVPIISPYVLGMLTELRRTASAPRYVFNPGTVSRALQDGFILVAVPAGKRREHVTLTEGGRLALALYGI